MSNSRWMNTLATNRKHLTRCSPDWTTLTCLGLAARRNGAKWLWLNGYATSQLNCSTFSTFRYIAVSFRWKGSEQLISYLHTSHVKFYSVQIDELKSWKSTKVDLKHLKMDGLVGFEVIRIGSTFKINFSLKEQNLELRRIFSKHSILVHFKPNRILRQNLVHLKACLSVDDCWWRVSERLLRKSLKCLLNVCGGFYYLARIKDSIYAYLRIFS